MTDKELARAWYKAMKAQGLMAESEKEQSMNLALIQRPKKVKARGNKLYIYAPSVLMEGFSLKAESIIHILEVHEGDSPEETTLKVIEHEAWQTHIRIWDWRKECDGLCTIVLEGRGKYSVVGKESERPKCGCEKELAEMPEELRKATHFVLLSDIGK